MRKAGWFLAFLSLAACARRVPLPPPAAPIVSPIEGTWESSGRQGTMTLNFHPDGRLMFQGGLTFFNPGRWEYDPFRHSLALTFPEAPDDKIQVFKLYLHDGVQDFDRIGKTVTYRFDDQTTSLNIAGWIYTKVVKNDIKIAPEPVLR
jgi:hypothetical protein